MPSCSAGVTPLSAEWGGANEFPLGEVVRVLVQ